MPGTLSVAHVPTPSVAGDVCSDCSGSGEVIDRDGSVSGTVGAVVPCICAEPCPKCSGSGEVWGLWVLSAEQENYFEGVGPCSCQRGRA